MRSSIVIVIAVLTWCLAPSARAQDEELCDPPIEGVDQTFPADRATQVPLDAAIRVRYGASPPRDAENVVRVREAGTERDVPGVGQRAGREIVFVANEAFAPTTQYELVAPDPLVGDRISTFTTGVRMDAGPPVFGALREVTSEPVHRAACGAPDGGYRITATFDAARDDGAPEDLEYVVYQTRGPGVVEPLERARVRGLNPDQQFAAFLLPEGDADAPICIAVLAYDGQGAVGGDGREKCLDPVQGNYFSSCTVFPLRFSRGAPGYDSRARGAAWLLAALVGVAIVRRSRRRTRAHAIGR